MFPMFLKVEGRRVLVVGAGAVAEGKIRGLFEAGASVQVVAPEAVWQIQKWAWEGVVDWKARAFVPSDLDTVTLVIAATSSHEVNSQRLRRELEEQFGPEYEEWVAELGEARQQLTAKKIPVEPRRQLLHGLASEESFANRNKAHRENN